MASSISHHLFCIQSLHHQFRCFCYSTNPPSNKPSALLKNPNFSLRLRSIVPKSTPRESPSTSLERPVQEPETSASGNRVKSPDPSPSSRPSLNSISTLLHRLREEIMADQLGLDILSIALPAALALAADPLTSLVDTAFVGHLGSAELAAVGVSASVFNLVSKLFNIPLLNITTSFVAEEQALLAKSHDESHQIDQDHVTDRKSKKILPSVSTSLALAAGIGVAETLALFFGSGFLMNTLGFTNAWTS